MKETIEKSQHEKQYFDKKISALNSFVKVIRIGNVSVVAKFSFEMIFTMIDGKVASAVLNVSSAQRCNVCLATPTQIFVFITQK